MGNTKSYYFEGELLGGVTLEALKSAIYENFHSTYCVAEIVEEKGGYLGCTDGQGPFVLLAIHSYSLCGDSGPRSLIPFFVDFRMHRVDSDWADVWVAFYDSRRTDGEKFRQWKAHDSEWSKIVMPPEGITDGTNSR